MNAPSTTNKRTRLLSLLLLLGLVLAPAALVQATPPIAGNTVEFADSGQSLGSSDSFGTALGDLDGDGDLDALVTNNNQPNRVWINQGGAQAGTPGAFSDSGQTLGSSPSWDVGLGDLDGDGDLDAFIANGYNRQPNKVWINQGGAQAGTPGVFNDSGQTLGNSTSRGVMLGDLDSDGDLDAITANDYGEANKVWINQGGAQAGTPGVFSDSLQSLGNSKSQAAGLGDLDGDGDLDAFIANFGPDKVWLNDGNGSFSDSTQSLGNAKSHDVALGDVDKDGDLDAFAVGSTLWLNDGSGSFSDSGLNLISGFNYGVALGDLDGDGDLDAYVGNGSNLADRVWQNDGSGAFSNSGLSLGNFNSNDVALGDLDGDGDLDALAAVYGNAGNKVWRNDSVHRNAPFVDSGQSLGSSSSFAVALGDMDKDGDLDAFVTNEAQPNKVWLNDGSGTFTDSGQNLGSANSYDVALGDVDRDGDLDAFVANYLGQPNKVWLNDGSGTFSDSDQNLGSSNSFAAALGDVDGDGDLDAFVTNRSEPNKVWLNDGSGTLSDSGQNLGSSWSLDVALGDLDGDGDLDAFVANSGAPNKVWLNDGNGTFSDSGQNLGSSTSDGLALGDVDGDGDLDAFVVNENQSIKVWLNDGNGTFSDSGQSLGSSLSFDVALGDVDGDGDLDAFVANFINQPNKVWLNDGSGTFTDSGQNLGNSQSWGMALGDMDGDGDLDAFVANNGQANKVWRNEGGSAGFAVTDTAPAGIVDGYEDDLMKVVFAHNGIAADRTLELNKFELDLLGSDCSTALTSAEANAIIDNLRVRLDDGDDTFESDGSDTAVADVGSLSLTGGVQTVSFTNGDDNVQVTTAESKTYWISVLMTSDASSQSPNAFCLNIDPDADALVEGKTPDFSVSQQDTGLTSTGGIGAMPTAVELASFSAAPQGSAIRLDWETASELDNLGFNLYRSEPAEGERVQLNTALIPGQNPGSPAGAAYSFVDETAEPGVIYTYWLEVVDTHGGAMLHGPVQATVPSSPYRYYLPLVCQGGCIDL
jgi:hypothetical protein